ncbi:MAG: hypothetical protein ACJ748_05910 [Flavisolibacter sp.]
MGWQSDFGKLEGTIGDITYYKMDGIFYARKKSTLSREKVLNSPEFKSTRIHAMQLAEASKMASEVYQAMQKEKRKAFMYRKLTGIAKKALDLGYAKEEIIPILKNYYGL